MKNYSKIGNKFSKRRGRPGYRTPSSFRARKSFRNLMNKSIISGFKNKKGDKTFER